MVPSKVQGGPGKMQGTAGTGPALQVVTNQHCHSEGTSAELFA